MWTGADRDRSEKQNNKRNSDAQLIICSRLKMDHIL